uniref:Upstream binding transcription factor n=1 Tax=Sarcophilus harrisii TaxID=9305 RepID=A0A7N4P2H7_SARHA
MNGEADCPTDLEMAVPKGQDRWSQEDMLTLLECMKNNLPSNDSSKFKTTESHMDWEKVAFKDFSGDMCKLKWVEISNEVRKFRTLTELILDAQEHVKNPYKGKKLKKHPDFPKKPLTPYFRFFMEKRAKYAKLHPEMSNLDLTKILSKKYKELPEKKKAKYKAREAALKAQSERKPGTEREERGKLPESPKTAEEIWQQSVIGDYLARFKNDRVKALKAMEVTWNNMEKKEKLMWIKKAAEDQKRYERELSEMRAPPATANSSKKMKFQGEPKKPPMNGYQKFSQELLSNGELNHLPLKERMVEIGSRWQRISQGQKEHYKKLAEEQQKQYKVHLDLWVKSLSPQDRAAYKEYISNKRKSMTKLRGPNPKSKPTMQSKSESEEDDDDDEEEEEDEEDDDDDENGDSSDEGGDSSESSSEDESEDGDENDDDEEDDDEDEDEDEDEDNESEGSSSSSSSSGDSSDSDSN